MFTLTLLHSDELSCGGPSLTVGVDQMAAYEELLREFEMMSSAGPHPAVDKDQDGGEWAVSEVPSQSGWSMVPTQSGSHSSGMVPGQSGSGGVVLGQSDSRSSGVLPGQSGNHNSGVVPGQSSSYCSGVVPVVAAVPQIYTAWSDPWQMRQASVPPPRERDEELAEGSSSGWLSAFDEEELHQSFLSELDMTSSSELDDKPNREGYEDDLLEQELTFLSGLDSSCSNISSGGRTVGVWWDSSPNSSAELNTPPSGASPNHNTEEHKGNNNKYRYCTV